jgi:hypothetical protein
VIVQSYGNVSNNAKQIAKLTARIRKINRTPALIVQVRFGAR